MGAGVANGMEGSSDIEEGDPITAGLNVGASRQLRKELRTPAAYLRSCEGRSSESREARGCPYIRRSTCSLYPVTAPDCAGRATSNLLKPGQSRVVAQ
jgi:hypothetical protein